jgi:hypothetical protein
MIVVGQIYLQPKGWGNLKNDPKEGLRWLRRAEAFGVEDAKIVVARFVCLLVFVCVLFFRSPSFLLEIRLHFPLNRAEEKEKRRARLKELLERNKEEEKAERTKLEEDLAEPESSDEDEGITKTRRTVKKPKTIQYDSKSNNEYQKPTTPTTSTASPSSASSSSSSSSAKAKPPQQKSYQKKKKSKW